MKCRTMVKCPKCNKTNIFQRTNFSNETRYICDYCWYSSTKLIDFCEP